MNVHRTKTITINNKEIEVDFELADLITKLNELGYKTSGCCVGDEYKETESFVII